MTTFKKLPADNNIQELIKATFDTELSLSGNWGYTQEEATVINALPKGMPLHQLEHMLISIRTHLEMNLTQKQENRYGGINANEKERKTIYTDQSNFNKVTYTITAMKEDIYTTLIKEYKENYGKEEFDLNTHFKKRDIATITREVTHYFEISKLS